MSIQAISSALGVQGITPSEKLLLIALANYANPKMICFPSHSTLAEDTCLNERTIRRLLVALESRGLITRKAQFRSNKSRTSDLITLYFGTDTMPGGVGGLMPGGVGTLTTKGTDTTPAPEPLEPLDLTSRTSARAEKRALSATPTREPCADGRIEKETAKAAFAELAQALSRRKA